MFKGSWYLGGLTSTAGSSRGPHSTSQALVATAARRHRRSSPLRLARVDRDPVADSLGDRRNSGPLVGHRRDGCRHVFDEGIAGHGSNKVQREIRIKVLKFDEEEFIGLRATRVHALNPVPDVVPVNEPLGES